MCVCVCVYIYIHTQVGRSASSFIFFSGQKKNKRGNVCVTWKFDKNCIVLCVCVCVCVGGCTGAAVFLHTCSLTYPVCHAQSPYCLRPLAPPHFSILSHIRHDFWKKLLSIKCVFWFSLQLLFETFLILRGNKRDIAINVKTCLCKGPATFVPF